MMDNKPNVQLSRRRKDARKTIKHLHSQNETIFAAYIEALIRSHEYLQRKLESNHHEQN